MAPCTSNSSHKKMQCFCFISVSSRAAGLKTLPTETTVQLKPDFKSNPNFVNILLSIFKCKKTRSVVLECEQMAQLTVSEIAQQVGIRPSAIRYYERIGVLPLAQRISGQRRYDSTALHRLAVIQWARQTGFTLDEIKQLFFGFRDGVPASRRWRQLSRRKLSELELQLERITTMQQLLRRMTRRCHCDTLDECGRGIFRKSAGKKSIAS
jgi:MerR family transcriptional regulator, redox-sensitive transcriptional activator SoxR